MNQRNCFYVTLDSRKTDEFPHNTSSAFQKRLPLLLDLTKPGWKVGLHFLFLPNEGKYCLNLGPVPAETPLFHMQILAKSSSARPDPTPILVAVRRDALLTAVNSSISAERALYLLIDQYRYKKFTKARPDSDYINRTDTYPNLHRMDFSFKWLPNGNLLVDNSDTRLGTYYTTPTITIHVLLALNMGWLQQEREGDYKLGPNLIYSTLKNSQDKTKRDYDSIRLPEDLIDIWQRNGKGTLTPPYPYWVILSGYMYLSASVNWTFLVQSKMELIRVYSNVTESSIVNDNIGSLLSEVTYKREGEGMVLPLHHRPIRYNDARQVFLENISIALLDLSGKPIDIVGEPSSVTLHFKREPCPTFTPL